MKNIEILDCTLRDGGRIIDCAFEDSTITGILKLLVSAKINIIELGFLRDNVTYEGNSTFFSSTQDADFYIDKMNHNPEDRKEKYVVFVDYGLYDIYKLKDASQSKVSGIRFGFTRKDYLSNKQAVLDAMQYIKQMNYDLYVQPVNTNGYSTIELIELIETMNRVSPKSFGIVDTYGSMYLDDLEYIGNIVNKNLEPQIAIDFHSHNNMQMSFALAQRMIQMVGEKRKLIIDATLEGMGKCAGNLNTELIVDYLSRKLDYDYNVDLIFDAIDRYIYSIKKENYWGYSIPAFMAGIYKAHPNNVIYLTQKYRLNNTDIKYILSNIEEGKRQRYDYENIQLVYKKYAASRVDDMETIEQLKSRIGASEVLVLAPGNTIDTYNKEIEQYILENNPTVICVNFKPDNIKYDFLFYANTIHWEKVNDEVNKEKCILSSNIKVKTSGTNIVDYFSLIEEDSRLFDNSTIMLLNLLNKLNVKKIIIAGFDGFSVKTNNYMDGAEPNRVDELSYEAKNREVAGLVRKFEEKTKGEIVVKFLTPSIYESNR